jgi:hypothetical protein
MSPCREHGPVSRYLAKALVPAPSSKPPGQGLLAVRLGCCGGVSQAVAAAWLDMGLLKRPGATRTVLSCKRVQLLLLCLLLKGPWPCLPYLHVVAKAAGQLAAHWPRDFVARLLCRWSATGVANVWGVNPATLLLRCCGAFLHVTQ